MNRSLFVLLYLFPNLIFAKSPYDGSSYLSLTNPNLPTDYSFQGEYTGNGYGAQIISLDKGFFQAVAFPGGLPGAGWDGKNKVLMDGFLHPMSSTAIFEPSDGVKSYLAQEPENFSATPTFPPPGQLPFSAKLYNGSRLVITTDKKERITLDKIIRKSPTIGKKAPHGSLILFDGSNTSSFQGGRLDPKTGNLHTDGRDILTKRKFTNYHIHLEFMLPYRPSIRGQHRGNSGFYQVDLYEMQILDSFGLHGHHFDCGGIYSQVPPKINACLPPLVWQTYDIDFTSAVVVQGKKTKNASITAILNGILIHQNYEFTGKTGGSRNEPEGTPGPLKLQGHANPLQFRNIWIIEK